MPLNAAYVSNGVPFGGFSTSLIRPSDPLNPGTNPTTLGTYVVETITLNHQGILGNRPAADGGDNGWFLVNGPIEGSATIQIASSTAPTPQNGDYFSLTVDVNGQNVEVDSAGAQVTRRVVLHSIGLPVGIGEYRKVSCSVRVDKFPS